MTIMKNVLLVILIISLLVPVTSQELFAGNRDVDKKKFRSYRKYDKVTPLNLSTKVKVFDQYGNLEYETSVMCHIPATEKLLPKGSVYLFTYKDTAYYMLTKTS